ncbi:DUF6531 domain-containing protein [Apibacter sp. HY039]|uniref:DUF6531 domain-containing protein n=1 Tax=Apibacter sp. HY039 TaxID=2501476 RepID=UPI000FEBE85E|nr:DUF6531 domain-containing protein [Apibacter sp. HY039]
MLLTDNHFTPVLGIDIHFTTLPPFNPFHPYIGLVLDPMDYIPFIGANVHVNGIKRGVSDTSGIIIPLVHIPLFTPPWLMAPIIGHESMNFFASQTVTAEGTRLSPKGHMLMTCNDIGIPLSIQPGKKKFWKLVPTLFAPTSYSLPIPTGSNVNVGGPYPPDWGGVLRGLAMSFGFGAIMNMGRKAFSKILKKCKGPKWLRKALCHAGFEPVNLINGAVFYEGTDFSLPGVIPLEWKRTWYSDSSYCGALGHGVHANYDLEIEIIPEEDAIAVRVEDGRVIAFPLLDVGDEFYLRQEKMTLKRNPNSFDLHLHENQQTYRYNHKVSEREYKLSTLENPAGFTLEFTYQGNILSEITDTAKRKIKIYSAEQKITRIALKGEDPTTEETLVEYRYDESGNMIGITDSLQQTTHIQYQGTLMVKKTDRNGQSFYWEYDGTTCGAKCVHTWGDGGLQEGRMEYFPEKGYNRITDAQGASTYYYYTADQLVTQIKDPLGNSRFFHYTEFMELYREIDEEGNCTGYSYDDRGNQTTITFADGSQQIFMYDEKDRLTLMISPEGQKRTYIYNEESQLLHAVIEPDDSFTVLGYNEKNLPSEIRKNEESLYMSYDAHNNLTTLTDPKGISTRWEYDFRGNVTRVKDASGLSQHFNYDKLGRVSSVQSEQIKTQFRYNAYEEILEAFDGKNKMTFQYTPLGSLLMREQNGVKVRFVYDKMERIKEICNEKEERFQLVRNARGDINQEIGFDRSQVNYSRDRAGKVIKVQKSGGAWTLYEYNLRGQVIRSEHSDGTWETYDYNKNGQLTEARNQDHCVKLNRDEVGRIIEEMQSCGLPDETGYRVASQYDENGRRVQITSSLGACIENTYDEYGNQIALTAHLKDTKESAGWQARIQRNHLGQEIEKELSGGIRLTTRYDSYGRVISSQVHTGRKETYNRQYSWNPSFKLSQVLNGLTQGKTEFTYDAFGSLASARYEDGSYDYKLPDEVGNLYKDSGKSEQVYGASGKLLKDKDWYYVYDKEGNLKRKTRRKIDISASVSAPLRSSSPFEVTESPNQSQQGFWIEENEFDRKAEIRNYSRAERRAYDRLRQPPQEAQEADTCWKLGDWGYEWQGNGMLKSVRTPEGKTISFTYDALGRRTAKFAGDKIYRYLWEGNVILHEWSYLKSQRPQVVTDELGMPTWNAPEPVENLVTWIYEEGNLVPSGKITERETTSIVSDYLGRPAQAYNEQGECIWETEYDIYGNLRNLKGDSQWIPFRQLGQYEDVETGLYYNRFRYYSPQTGSYISKDPIGLAGNNPNLYAYTHDSNTMVDPWGLDESLLGSKDNPFTSLKQAMNKAKDLAGIPRSQQPDRQWKIGDDITKKGSDLANYQYDSNPGSHGRMYEFTDANGHKKVIAVHTNDGQLHVHAGNPKGEYPHGWNSYDFKTNRYAKIDDPNLKDHHLFVKVECK